MDQLMLTKDNVKLKVEADNWEEAVRIGGGMLVESGCVKDTYVEGIISSIKELGPYIIIADGIAIPHTRPEKGSLKIGCSLITLKEPVYFEGDESAVKIMICFSAVDNASHLDVLRMIMEFINEDMIDEIAKVDTYEELIELINKNN